MAEMTKTAPPPSAFVKAPDAFARLTDEIHSKKKDVELKVGDILTFEGGLARSFYARVDDTPLPGIPAIPEFGAVNRTQGWTLMATLGYQAKLLAKAP